MLYRSGDYNKTITLNRWATADLTKWVILAK